MNSRVLFFTLIFALTVPLFAQTSDYISAIQEPNEDQGHISIVQDEQIHLIVNKYISTMGGKTIRGYRIRIFSDSGSDAKERAETARTTFLRSYPFEEYGMHSYVKWVPPNFKVYIGDFRTKNEALKFQKMIADIFPYAFYVTDKINLPNL